MKKRGRKPVDPTAWVVSRRTIAASAVRGKRVLIRCDYNVPVKNGVITDDTRIRASLETLRFCLKSGARQLILVSHLGRPKPGERDAKNSLKPVAQRLQELLRKKVILAPSCLHTDFVKLPAQKRDAPVILLENVRLHSEEEMNDLIFAKQLALFADVFVNDAFGTAHRAHASNGAITQFLPAYIGFLMRDELAKLGMVTYRPKRPLIVIIGFAKISDKLHALTNLLKLADVVLVGGAVAFTFLAAQGKDIGTSIVEKDSIPLATTLLRKYRKKIVLPLDIVCATGIEAPAHLTFDVDHIPPDMAGLDIGTKTLALFSTYLNDAKTVFWNGPVGMFEQKPYDAGTVAIARTLASLTSRKMVFTVVGGGDTASAAGQAGVAKKLSHVSTGGGASLEFMEGKPLAAIAALYRSSLSK